MMKDIPRGRFLTVTVASNVQAEEIHLNAWFSYSYLTVTFSVNAPMRQAGSPAFTGAP